ncbi:DNA-binding protein [Geovibrio thiophilus]|uniref:DNA-binding protein n=2 Tax=Geovibrio thiophilus TaxID=139438 RepID=A0A410JVQ2_9BACT|nr:DNA-binding protein [Geovibrio thiophilus]
MNYSDNAINVLSVKSYRGVGRAWIMKNMKGNESINTIVDLLNQHLKETITVEDFYTTRQLMVNKIMRLKNHIDGVVAIGDDNFPSHRGNVKQSEQPVVLFYRGDLSLLNKSNKNIAVIGLLTPDSNIEDIEKKIVSELIKHKITIVSGLALGCDSIAHKQAIDSNGTTIAILPSSLDDILPASNKVLAKEIISKNGLLVTEYYEKAKSKQELASRYQDRDRLQALFSDGIILSASYAKNDQGNDSGSRLAMKYALNYSIPRAVLYNFQTNGNDPKYDLNRQIINEDSNVIVINSENLTTSLKIIIEKTHRVIYKPLSITDFL